MVDLFYSIRITLDKNDYAEKGNAKKGDTKKSTQKPSTIKEIQRDQIMVIYFTQ